MATKVLCLIVLAMMMLEGNAQLEVTLPEIFVDKKYEAKTVPGFHFMKDGKSFARLQNDKIIRFDLVSGEELGVLFDAANVDAIAKIDGYAFNLEEDKILLRTASEKIYRHSTRDHYYVIANGQIEALHEHAKQSHATFSPDGQSVAFVSENNLYMKHLTTGKTTQITRDGKENYVINGAGDWVYEEEFVLVRAFEWSPDSKRIAFVRFNESNVPEFTMMNYRDDLYPEYVTFKYPKVGENNSKVEVKIYDTEKNRTVSVKLGGEKDIYIPRIKWTTDPEKLCITRLNRLQNALDLLLADAKNGRTKVIMHEDNQYYIDIHDNLTFLPDGEHFLWMSEQDGYNHIYLYNMKGKIVEQLTKGRYDITDFYGFDEQRGRIYFQAASKNALDREVYSIDLKGKEQHIIADQAGSNSAQFSTTYDYYVLQHSSWQSPPRYSVHQSSGDEVRLLEDNNKLLRETGQVAGTAIEKIEVDGADGTPLNGWIMKPAEMRSNRKYPLLMFVYGGPGSQMVLNQWDVRFRWWFYHLTQQGYVVACVDNRGTGARGQAFKKSTYLDLGKLETADQTAAARQLGALRFIDEDRMGIFGWSYGGYMSSLCILKSPDVFKAAIAVAPVTNWKWYDSIYTERYMRTENTNKSGYTDNSPVYFADQLKGDYFIVHGLGDDNVHFQHTAEMVNALVAKNKPFETMFYPNRAHGIVGDNARIHLFTKMTEFITDKL